jgi:hypothetical protein
MWALLALGLVSIIHLWFILFREVGPSHLVEHLFTSLPLSPHFFLSFFFFSLFFMSCPSLFESTERYKIGTLLANFQQGSLFLIGHKVLCHTGDSLYMIKKWISRIYYYFEQDKQQLNLIMSINQSPNLRLIIFSHKNLKLKACFKI